MLVSLIHLFSAYPQPSGISLTGSTFLIHFCSLSKACSSTHFGRSLMILDVFVAGLGTLGMVGMGGALVLLRNGFLTHGILFGNTNACCYN